jgi:hypothetical protein
MSNLQSFQAMLTLKLNEIDAICHDWGYNASPTLLLRHPDGVAKSILLSNDSLGKVVLCIAELGDTGRKSDQSPTEAILTLFKGDDRT